MRGVYCIHCLVTNKKYVGSSIDIERRVNKHFHRGRSKGRSNLLYRDIDAYGRDMFVCGVIEECDDNIKERERYWIEYYNTIAEGYNIRRSYFSEEEYKEVSRRNSRNRRAKETPEQRQKRLERGIENQKNRLRKETPEERQLRLEKQREYDRKRYWKNRT